MYPKSDFSGYSIAIASRTEADPLVRAHYLKRWPGVTVATLGMWKGPFLVGVVVFALPPRETMKRYRVELAWELARLYIMDSEPFNSETWFMAKAIKWVRTTHPLVEMLVSYADPSAGHRGVIYRAANWKSDGRTDQERKTPRFDYGVGDKIYSRRAHVPEGVTITRIPRISKHRFIYRLNGRATFGVTCLRLCRLADRKSSQATTSLENGKTVAFNAWQTACGTMKIRFTALAQEVKRARPPAP